MKRKIRNSLFMELGAWGLALWVFFFLTSCRDIFERNLEKISIAIQAPPDNYKSTTFAVNFLWDEVKGATHYRLQIASPNFTNITQLVLDTPATTNQFSYTLKPGSYCWRVRAENKSSNTEYATRCLSIDSTPNLSAQQLVLASPVNNYATTQTSITFRWYPILNADDYRFELHTPDFNGSLVLNPAIIRDTFWVVTGLAEARYEWGVRGQNTFSNTAFSTRKFIIDTTSPATPVMLAPASNDTLDGSSMDFTWTQVTDSGSTISDSLRIFSDSTGATVKKEYYTTATLQNVDTLSAKTYFWQMRAIDAAGNKSGYSSLRKFVVK